MQGRDWWKIDCNFLNEKKSKACFFENSHFEKVRFKEKKKTRLAFFESMKVYSRRLTSREPMKTRRSVKKKNQGLLFCITRSWSAEKKKQLKSKACFFASPGC